MNHFLDSHRCNSNVSEYNREHENQLRKRDFNVSFFFFFAEVSKVSKVSKIFLKDRIIRAREQC